MRQSVLESGRVDTTVTQEGRRGTEPASQSVSVGRIKVWGMVAVLPDVVSSHQFDLIDWKRIALEVFPTEFSIFLKR